MSSRQRGEPAYVLLHTVIDHKRLDAEIRGSWLHSAIFNRVLDCGHDVADVGRSQAAKVSWPATSFRALPELLSRRNASELGGAVHEMFFVMLTPDFIAHHNAEFAHTPVRLTSCSQVLDPNSFEGMHREAPSFTANWHHSGLAPPPTLTAALRAATPDATVVVTLSWTPDLGRSNVRAVAKWLRARGVDPERRGLVLHYRAGRLPSGWQNRLTRGDVRAHVALGSGLPREAFWNSFWPLLTSRAQAERQRQLCVAARLPGRACNTSVLARWCAERRRGRLRSESRVALPPPLQKLPRPAQPRPAHQLLVLGGDAHYGREYVMRRLHYAGLLDNRTLWSLSKPEQCTPGRGGVLLNGTADPREERLWQGFCGAFTQGGKQLDRPLMGPQSTDNAKDMDFAPVQLYAKTRFSLVFESVVSSSGNPFPTFLTEKVIKPLALSHPFLLVCAGYGAWEFLRNLGFRSFSPVIPEDFVDAWEGTGREWPCQAETLVDSAYVDQLISELKRLMALSDAEWAPAVEAAAHNQRHMAYADGLTSYLTLTLALAPTAHRSPLAARRSPLAARRSPLTARRSPLASHLSPSALTLHPQVRRWAHCLPVASPAERPPLCGGQ